MLKTRLITLVLTAGPFALFFAKLALGTKSGGMTRLRRSARKRSRMSPTATTLQSASGYMKKPPLKKSWMTVTCGGGVGACWV